jgi:hypothetical protein
MVHTASDIMALYNGILADVPGLGEELKNKSFGT